MAFTSHPVKSGAAFVSAPVQYTASAPPVSTVTSVALAPAAMTLAGGATQQFAWSVAGTNSPSQAVALSATAGSIDVGGLFVAPAATDVEQVISVTATSTQDPSKSGTATVVVLATAAPAVTPSPTAADISLFTIMQMSTINLQANLGPAAINLTVSLS